MKQKCDTVTHVIHKMECFLISNAEVEKNPVVLGRYSYTIITLLQEQD